MAFSRHTRDEVSFFSGGLKTSRAVALIRKSIFNGSIPITTTVVITERDRLDSLAASVYGDGRYWWVLAAASNVGWGLQVPPGTLINIIDLRYVENLIG